VLLGVLLLGLGSAALLWHFLPSLVLLQIVQEARKHGVELSECEITLSQERILLSACRVQTLEGVDAQGRVEAIALVLTDWKPSRADVTGAVLDVRSAPELQQLLEYQPSSRTPIPVRVTESRLSWYPDGSLAPLLVLSELSYDTVNDQLDAQLSSPGLLAGTLAMNREALAVQLSLLSAPDTSFAARLTHRAPASGDAPINQAGKRENLGADLELDVNQLPAHLLHMPMFLEIPEPLHKVTVDAKVRLALPAADRAGQARGSLKLSLKHLPLPIPAAFSGLVVGEETLVEAEITLDRAYTKLKLQNLSAKHGALELKGSGTVERVGLGLELQSRLRGRLSCKAIAQVALSAQLDPVLAKMVSRIARRTIEGGVDIGVDLKAHTSKLAEAQLTKLVGVGCGLKSLSFEDAVELGEDVLNNLPDIKDWPLLKIDAPKFEGPKLSPPKLKLPNIQLPFPGRKGALEPERDTSHEDTPN
jgi:hypothetical protein